MYFTVLEKVKICYRKKKSLFVSKLRNLGLNLLSQDRMGTSSFRTGRTQGDRDAGQDRCKQTRNRTIALQVVLYQCITEHEGCKGQDRYNQIQDRMAGQDGCGTRRIRDKTYTGQGGQGGFWTIDGCKQMQERSDVGQNG